MANKTMFRTLKAIVFFVLTVALLGGTSGNDGIATDGQVLKSGIIPRSEPGANAVLSAEEAEQANGEALSSYHEKASDRPDMTSPAAFPTAVPVLTPEEAERNNREALRIYRNKSLKKKAKTFFNGNNLLYVLTGFALAVTIALIMIKIKRKENIFNLKQSLHVITSVSLLAFGILVFVPWSVYFGNSSQFPFIFSDFAKNNLLFLFVVIYYSAFLLLVLPRTVSDYLVALIAGVGLGVYIQSMFMNCFLGEMNGDELELKQHFTWGVMNAIIWCVIVMIPCIARIFLKKYWNTIVLMSSGAVLLLEIVASTSMVLSAPESVWSRNNKFFIDGTNQFQLSSEKNIFVLVLDTLGCGYVKQSFKESPELKDVMKDFTWYVDARSNYFLTFPSLHHELTGSFVHPAKDEKELFYNTWHSPSAISFYKQVQEAGYETRLFIKKPVVIGREENYHEYFSNISIRDIKYEIDNTELRHCLVRMSGFSGMPFFLKNKFIYDHDFAKKVVREISDKNLSDIATIPQANDTYLQKLLQQGITTDAEKPIISFQYTMGVHKPWHINEKCEYTESPFDSPIPTAKSCFYLIAELIRQLKEQNIYDKTAIIILADHNSWNPKYCTPFDMAFMIKPFNTKNQSVTEDNAKVQTIDIVPTLLQIACGDNADYSCFEGFPINRIPSDRQRRVYPTRRHPGLPPFFSQDGKTKLERNCLVECRFDDAETFDEEKCFLRYIPFNNSVEIDEKDLTTWIPIR